MYDALKREKALKTPQQVWWRAVVLTYTHEGCCASVSIIKKVYLETDAAVVLIVRPQ